MVTTTVQKTTFLAHDRNKSNRCINRIIYQTISMKAYRPISIETRESPINEQECIDNPLYLPENFSENLRTSQTLPSSISNLCISIFGTIKCATRYNNVEISRRTCLNTESDLSSTFHSIED